MIDQIRQMLKNEPFEPFQVLTSGGAEYQVPIVDHVSFNPKGTRVIVYVDDDTHITLSPLHIVGVREKTVNPA